CAQEYRFFGKIYHSVLYRAVRGFDKSKSVYFRKYTKRRNKSNIWTLRSFNRTKTTVVGIMNVTNLETCTLTRQTSGPKCRHTTFVRYFSQWICLIHKL